MIPSIGRTVIVRNHGFAGVDAPAVVTRVWSPTCVNLQVLPDCAPPVCKTSVPFYASREAAEVYLAQMVGHAPVVAFWPDRL